MILIALILIGGLWAIVASAFLIWTIFGLVGALRDSSFFRQPENHSSSKSFCLTKNRRKRRRRSK